MTPDTAAGKALLAKIRPFGKGYNKAPTSESVILPFGSWPDAILAIEAEARREPLALLRALVTHLKRMSSIGYYPEFHKTLDEARAYLAALPSGSPEPDGLPEQEVEGS